MSRNHGADDQAVSIEERLEQIRAGYTDLTLKLGDFDVPVRLLDHIEEMKIVQQAKIATAKLPAETDKRLHESTEIMKHMLQAVSTINNTPFLPLTLLNRLTSTELDFLFDQYQSICKKVNPEFEKLTDEECAILVAAIKKKDKKPSDLFTWQLAAIGRFFLEAL